MFKKSFTFEIGLNILCCLKSPNTSFKLKKEEEIICFLIFCYLENDTKNKYLPQSCIEQIDFASL